MKTIDDINLETWFVDREISRVPDHFTHTKTPIGMDARAWILEKLRGRFVITPNFCPAFEDPKEAVFYELTWG